MIALRLCAWLAAAFALVTPAGAQAASTQSPAVAPPTSSKTVDELYYYAVRRPCALRRHSPCEHQQLYYERAAFIYANFPVRIHVYPRLGARANPSRSLAFGARM